MRFLTWYILIAVVIVYSGIAAVFPISGLVGSSIHFTRVTMSVAAWIIYMRMMPTLFRKVPPPLRDHLLAAINFFLLSLVCFSFWNEAGRIFGVDTSPFTSYVAAAFSMFAIVACVLALIAADTDGPKPKYIAVGIALVVAIALVFVAPQFRLGR